MTKIPTTFDEEFSIPKGLSSIGLKVAKAIRSYAKKRNLETGGCTTFYSTQQWKDRREEFGTESELVIVHDGGDIAKFFNYDYQDYTEIERMNKLLKKYGVYFESCTSWYSAIYKL
jgi:hypothetical protein